MFREVAEIREITERTIEEKKKEMTQKDMDDIEECNDSLEAFFMGK